LSFSEATNFSRTCTSSFYAVGGGLGGVAVSVVFVPSLAVGSDCAEAGPAVVKATINSAACGAA
jgi:hypothetical protein